MYLLENDLNYSTVCLHCWSESCTTEPRMSSSPFTFTFANSFFPSGVPPSLYSYPLTNPSTHFTAGLTCNGSHQESLNITVHAAIPFWHCFSQVSPVFWYHKEEPAIVEWVVLVSVWVVSPQEDLGLAQQLGKGWKEETRGEQMSDKCFLTIRLWRRERSCSIFF